ncbi:MAG: DnaA regulatory inactivator Hda [Burkholderiaceae bacterium]
MRQLLLDLPAQTPQTLASFVAGRNGELLARLERFAAGDASIPDRTLYLWGPSGAGKTHLLQALAASPETRYLDADAGDDEFVYASGISLWLLDDCDRLSPAAQVAAFGLFNQVREHGALLVAAGSAAPMQLPLREDLRTRLGWGLVYQLHELSDDEKVAALERAARARGMMVAPGVLPYLLTHFERDMRSLSSLLDALDRHSLEMKRPITLPLLRDLLQHGAPHRPDSDSNA